MAILNIQSLWNWDDPAASERAFRGAAGEALSHADALEYETQIARAEGLQRKFDEAHATLDIVERALPATTNAPVVEVRYLLERGRVFNSSGKPDKARPLFLTAWDKARAGKFDFLTVDAAHMMGIIEPPDAALEWNEKAVALAEKSPDLQAQGWLGALYNNIGWTYYDKREFAKALDYFERDRKWYESRNAAKEVLIARYSIGKTYRALGRYEEALALQRELLKLTPDDGHVHEEIAECLLALGKTAEARLAFGRAYVLLANDEWFAANEPKRLARLKQLSAAAN